MKTVTIFESANGARFNDEAEARTHERRDNFSTLFGAAMAASPMYARLDRELMLDFLMQHGIAVGEIANNPLTVEPPYKTKPADEIKEIPFREMLAQDRRKLLEPARSSPALGASYIGVRPTHHIQNVRETAAGTVTCEVVERAGLNPADPSLDAKIETTLHGKAGTVSGLEDEMAETVRHQFPRTHLG